MCGCCCSNERTPIVVSCMAAPTNATRPARANGAPAGKAAAAKTPSPDAKSNDAKPGKSALAGDASERKFVRTGMTEAEVRKSGRSALMGQRPMTRVSRAVEKGETNGFMKIMVDAKTHEILGAAILGVGGDEAIHCVLDAMYAKAPYSVVQRAVHIHPTVAELIPTILGELKPLPAALDS